MTETLTQACIRLKLDPIEAMNILQNKGHIVSDECVFADDVADCDAPAAIEFLAKVMKNRNHQ